MDLTTILFVRCGTVADLGYLGDRSNELASFPHGPFTYPVPGGVLFTSNANGIEWAMKAIELLKGLSLGIARWNRPLLVPFDLSTAKVTR